MRPAGGRTRYAPAAAVAGVAVMAVGLWALARDVERWNALWYVPAWYGYLLLVDAAIDRLGGRSFLRRPSRRRETAAMMLWSVPFWYLYEAYNLRLENWYYVFVLRHDGARALVSALSFATVLPACFFHAELVRSLGWWRRVDWRPRRVGRGLQALWAGMGVACVLLPLAAPRQAFALVWGATFWLPDLASYRLGAPSILGDLERGRGGRLMRLLAGGLWAGVAWELLNYRARCKWIYTVPGFEDWKLFEMPLAGFLGFPALALAAFAYYALLSHLLRGGRRWEDAEPRPRRPASRLAYGVALLVAAVFCAVVYRAGIERSVASRRPLLVELEGLDAAAARRLRVASIPTPERLHAALTRRDPAEVARRTGLAPERLAVAGRHAALALHKGMGPERARLLLRTGVARPEDLAAADPEGLHRRLVELAAETDVAPPRLAEVRVWVRAARLGSAPRR